MTQTRINVLDLDPSLRHRDDERQPMTEEEMKTQQEADREAVSTLYAGIGGVDTTRIERTLVGEERSELGENNPDRREVAATEVIDTLQGNRLDAIVHDQNVEDVQGAASTRLNHLLTTSSGEAPGVDSVERRVFGKDLHNALHNKVTEGIGLDTQDQREITRAATAGEFMDMITKRHDTSGLEHLPPQTAIWVASKLQRLVERYGDADHTPTEQLTAIGRYLENIDAVTATSEGKSYVVFDKETGQPEERDIDTLVSAAMAGDFETVKENGVDLAEDDHAALTDINGSFENSSSDALGAEEHARRIRALILRVINRT